MPTRGPTGARVEETGAAATEPRPTESIPRRPFRARYAADRGSTGSTIVPTSGDRRRVVPDDRSRNRAALEAAVSGRTAVNDGPAARSIGEPFQPNDERRTERGARTPVRTVSNICIPTGLHGTRVDREPRGPDAPVVSACRIRPGTPGMTVSRPSRAAPVTGRVGRRRGGGRSRAGSARRPPRPSVSGPETPRNVLRSTSRCYPLRARPGSPAFGAFTSLSRRHPPSGPCTVSACDRSPHDFAAPRPAVPHHTA